MVSTWEVSFLSKTILQINYNTTITKILPLHDLQSARKDRLRRECTATTDHRHINYQHHQFQRSFDFGTKKAEAFYDKASSDTLIHKMHSTRISTIIQMGGIIRVKSGEPLLIIGGLSRILFWIFQW